MPLSNGRSYLAIPGPSVVPDRVLNAMHQASPNIYDGPLIDMVETLYPDLRAVARTTGDVAIYMGNGHGAWEASLTNVLSREDQVLVLVTGAFGLGWAEAAQGLGLNVKIIDFGRNAGLDFDRVAKHLKADKSHNIKAILGIHTDTATSNRNDIKSLRGCIDSCQHPALLMVDCIASLGCDPFEMDDWGVDVAIAASQKGLMLPPGLFFVFFNEKADVAHKTADMVTPYWNWTPRAGAPELFRKFCGTAPTHHLLGLRESLNMLVVEETIPAVWARHAKLARSVWAALDCWGNNGPMTMNIPDAKNRSNAVTTVNIGEPFGTKLRDWTEANAGVTLGISLGMADPAEPKWHAYFRIAHMGHVNAHMTLGVLGTIEAALIALEIPHGAGALTAAAKIVSEA